MDQSGLTTRDVIGAFYQRLDVDLAQSWMGQISVEFNSDQESETYKFLGMSPQMREWIGGREPRGLRENGITIENKKYEATLEIDGDDFRRDKTGQIMVRINELADRATTHWGKLLTTLIEAGETDVCYDGQAYFDTDHSEGDSGTQTNDLAAGDYSQFNVADPAAPTANEMADIIMVMIQHMYSFKDDEGEPMNETAKNFLLQVPITYWAAAQTAVSEKRLDTGSGSRDNPVISNAFNVQVTTNARLTWTTKLALYRIDSTAAPFIRQIEQPIQMKMLGTESEHFFWNEVIEYGIKAVRNVGYGYWQYAELGTLS